MPLKLTKEELDALRDDEPIRLVDAPSVFFPYAAITVATLRTEVRKGRLELLRIGGKDFVTKRFIREMRDSAQSGVATRRAIRPTPVL